MGRPDSLIGRTLEEMGLSQVDSADLDVLAPLPDRWELELWEQAESQIKNQKKALMDQYEQGLIKKPEFQTELLALNQRVAAIYQELAAAKRTELSPQSAE